MPRGIYPRKKKRVITVKDHVRSPPVFRKATNQNLAKAMDLLAGGLDKIAADVKEIHARVKSLENRRQIVGPDFGYINVFSDGGASGTYPTRAEADMYARDDRIACARWEEGRFDE
jgi:hypothetical protein